MTNTGLPTEEFAHLVVQPGETIFLKGQPADNAYVILRGEVQAGAQSPFGKFVVLSRMLAGEMFGELALLKPDGRRSATTMSVEGCELLVIPGAIFDDRLRSADPLLHFVIGHLGRRLVKLSERVVDAGLEESQGRPAWPNPEGR